MSEEREERGENGMQNPITDGGADPHPSHDSNEDADARVRIEQPSGEEAPRAD